MTHLDTAATHDRAPGRPQLALDEVVVRYGPRLVLAGLTPGAGVGGRPGVVGENGSGKSTLLRVAAGFLPPESRARDERADGQ